MRTRQIEKRIRIRKEMEYPQGIWGNIKNSDFDQNYALLK